MKNEDVKPGMRIVHTIFGSGDVLRVKEGEIGTWADIKFYRFGIKRLTLDFAAQNMTEEAAP